MRCNKFYNVYDFLRAINCRDIEVQAAGRLDNEVNNALKTAIFNVVKISLLIRITDKRFLF